MIARLEWFDVSEGDQERRACQSALQGILVSQAIILGITNKVNFSKSASRGRSTDTMFRIFAPLLDYACPQSQEG